MNLSAVFWFARTTSRWETGRVEGMEWIVGGRGLSMTVPKWEKDDCVRGYVATEREGDGIEKDIVCRAIQKSRIETFN